jgi:hypothetical protein
VRLRRLTARPRPSRADSFWRATDFRRANIPTHARRTQQAHLVLGHADRSLAQDGRDLLGRDRVLPAYGLEAGRARRQEIHLRGSFAPTSSLSLSPSNAFDLAASLTVDCCNKQLFDTSSVVEYYESFAKHAFESTATSITMQCVVLAPDGRPVPCAFCFSVRRDLFSVRVCLAFLRETDCMDRLPGFVALETVSFPRHRFLPPNPGLVSFLALSCCFSVLTLHIISVPPGAFCAILHALLTMFPWACHSRHFVTLLRTERICS